MKTFKTFVFSLTLIVVGLTTSFAQEHGHSKAPHGGKVMDANDGYHLEMVKVKDSLNFFVIHPKEKPNGKITTPKVEFEFSNKTKSMSTATVNSSGKISVALPKANIVEFATPTIMVDGKAVTAKFKNEVSEADKAHGHEH